MEYTKPLIIYTDRLVLKSIDDLSLDSFISMVSNEEVSKTYMIPEFNYYEDKVKLFNVFKRLSNLNNRYVYGIYLDNLLIGFINEVEVVNNEIELGFVIDPKYKNKGYATEVLRKSIEVLFDLGFLVIKTGVFKENIPSMKVSEKANMTRLDKTIDIEYKGRMHTCIFYEIRKER